MWLALTAASTVGFVACSNDDNGGGGTTILVEDGLYIKGDGTALTDYNINGMMKVTRNEVLQTDKSTLFEKYISIKAGSAGFNIISVKGSTKTTYGPGTDFKVITNPTTDEPKVAFKRGSAIESTTPFTVDKDGLYQVVIDLELKKVVVIPVEYWGLIGAATPNGWSGDTRLENQTFDLNTMKFEGTNLKMGKGEMKFRHSGGWKVELDTVLVVADGKKGVKVNTNFGGAIDALLAGGDNIPFAAPGFYTASMTWTLASGFTAKLTKTADVELINYTNFEMGIIGNAYNKADGNPADWNENWGMQLPVVSGTTYTWTYDGVGLFADKEFKFRQGTDWSGKSIGYSDVTWDGAAKGSFVNNGGNIKVVTAGNYKLVLKIDAATEIYTITATLK